MARQFRRVVTGHNSEGKSIILMDGAPPQISDLKSNHSAVADLHKSRYFQLLRFREKVTLLMFY